MNIFFLDKDPVIAASYHCDKHVIKMILETAQILCTTYHLQSIEAPYRMTHRNHPSTIWARHSMRNFGWLVDLGLALCSEYTYRYKKIHKTQKHIQWAKENMGLLRFSNLSFTPPPKVMPEEFQQRDDNIKDTVESYRNYYSLDKFHNIDMRYKDGDYPKFIIEKNNICSI